MIRLSTRARYAARFLLELALNNTNGPLLLKDIACKQDISAGYLEQIVPSLKSSNLIISSRGSRGGYNLAREASRITIKDIIEAVEGPVNVTECLNISNHCIKSGGCAAEELWLEINIEISSVLESKTLEHLAERHKKKNKGNAQNYNI